MLRNVVSLAVVSLVAGLTTSAFAAKGWKDGKSILQADFPYQIAAIGANGPGDNIANKGMAIALGNDAYVCFDTDLVRMSAGWTGGYITEKGVTFNGSHGGHPMVAGDQKFATQVVPGWADANGGFVDKRPEPFGPIDLTQAQWKGHYAYGTNVVLHYTVQGAKVLEWPASAVRKGQVRFERTFKIDSTDKELVLLVCDVEKGNPEVSGTRVTVAGADGQVTQVGVVGSDDSVVLKANGGRVTAHVAAGSKNLLFKVTIWNGDAANKDVYSDNIEVKPFLPEGFDKGGAARWTQSVETKGRLNTSSTPDGAYTVDALLPPFKNPWNRRMRIGGFDFFSNGKSAAVSTWDGDVWIVSGIDEKLEKLTWKRFASGGFETLGLKIVDDVIYTSGRDQITRYHDLNGDGEADYYESFNNEITSSRGFHEFVFDLHADAEGNFYFAKAAPVRGGGRGFGGGGGNGEVSAHAGTVLRVNKDGSKLEVYATGLRAPNGIGVSPSGQVTTGDNEGTYVPACPVNWVRPGGYYGVVDTAHRVPVPRRDPPLVWLSRDKFDNSGGGQVWATSKKWGPFEGQLLHLSYGKCTLNVVFAEEVGGVMQGAALQLPLRFTSSAMRGRFNPADGQLYVAGLLGWQTAAVNPGGLDRVRYTGKPVYSISGVAVDKDGVHLTFTQPLDEEEGSDPESFSIERWNYATRFGTDKVIEGRLVRGPFDRPNYGGHEVSVTDPAKVGREDVDIAAATLSKDKKTVTLALVDHRPAEQVYIRCNISAEDGEIIKQDLLLTINKIE